MVQASILDLCTGSGCVAAALAKELPEAQFTLTDISKEALEVAKINLNFVKDRCSFLQGDLFSPLHDCTIAPLYNFITANPPYAAFSDQVDPEIAFEPENAVFAQQQGLAVSEKIIQDAPSFLKASGWLVMECGLGQAETLIAFAKTTNAYCKFETKKDLSGIERIISFQLKTDN